ncbi:hypothetical protein OF829_10770 [Sphingomonas sp. LB-2]|uniref:hypothetical protein n=1 Tax=Sphingomonas caeni TaxID=2984949 RepID=UPI002231459A|nr:hypothetical protein [Sphingomonas caeni]MCW3847723.1 hypothetical protein [Sphingomonas caeni]
MRNMMICVSVMLAVFLGWPLAFGGGEATVLQPSRAEARTVAVAATVPATAAAVQATPATPKAESCYKRYQREVRQCSGGAGAACRLKQADHWDMCEATGFWPE